jgi:hypothetical protein
MRALALLPLLAFAACTPDPSLITQAQQASMLACAFLPTAETVANIIATNNAAVSTAEQIAGAICAAVKNSGATSIAATQPTALLSPTSPAPTVFGVAVHGRFIGAPT